MQFGVAEFRRDSRRAGLTEQHAKIGGRVDVVSRRGHRDSVPSALRSPIGFEHVEIRPASWRMEQWLQRAPAEASAAMDVFHVGGGEGRDGAPVLGNEDPRTGGCLLDVRRKIFLQLVYRY